MSVLITGGTGFLGARLTRLLVEEQGQPVVIFDRYPAPERLGDLAGEVELVEGDILDPWSLSQAIVANQVERVVHLAAAFGTVRPERAGAYLELLCMGTRNVFEAARVHRIQRVVNASSTAVYGLGGRANGERGVDEEDPPAPTDLYGTCKAWSERVADFYNAGGLEILTLRISASLGYGRLGRSSLRAGMTTERRNYMAAPELVVLGEPVTLPPDDELADFLYVADTAAAIWRALDAPRPRHSIFNLRSEQRPMGDYTRALRRLMPEAEITVATEPSRLLPLMEAQRIRDELAFEPRYTLEQGLAEYVEAAPRGLRSGDEGRGSVRGPGPHPPGGWPATPRGAVGRRRPPHSLSISC
jgi:nucleoside-diphosphate-sugar epimerase